MTLSTELLKLSAKRWKPHPYQKKAVKWLLQHGAAALFLDPGLGKTSIVLAAVKVMLQKKIINRVLVVAPLRVCHAVWPEELVKWTDFHDMTCTVLHGSKKEDRLNDNVDIYIINPEGLTWLLKENARRLKKIGADTLIIDELTKFKHTKTTRFKALKPVLSTFARRWGLTGTPAANGLLDLFGQCYVLDLGHTLGRYITHYRYKYFYPVDPSGWKWALQPDAEQEIYKRLKLLALRMSAEDYLKLPKRIDVNIVVDLPPKVMKVYNHLEDEMIMYLGNHTISAVSAAVASNKCRQVANGGVYHDEDPETILRGVRKKKTWADLHGKKLDAVEELVNELQGGPLLVAYEFEHDLHRLLERFQGTPYIGGGSTQKATSTIIARWNDGELPLLFAHPQAAGHGLNLQQSCSHICWHSLTWNFELYDQFIRRVWRQGNTSQHIFVYHILARNTVDAVVLAALRSKSRRQQTLFDALSTMVKKKSKK